MRYKSVPCRAIKISSITRLTGISPEKWRGLGAGEREEIKRRLQARPVTRLKGFYAEIDGEKIYVGEIADCGYPYFILNIRPGVVVKKRRTTDERIYEAIRSRIIEYRHSRKQSK